MRLKSYILSLSICIIANVLFGQVAVTPLYTVTKFENGTGGGPLGRSGGTTFRFISTGGPFDSCTHWGFVAGNLGDTKMNMNNFAGPPTNSCSYATNEYFSVISGVNNDTLNLTASSNIYCRTTAGYYTTTGVNTRATVSTNTGTFFNVGNTYLLKVSGLDSFEITVEYESYSPTGRAYIGASTAGTWQPAVSLFDNLHTNTSRSICTEFESRLYAYSDIINADLVGGQDSVCSGDTVGTLVANSSGGSRQFTYQWFENGMLIANNNSDTLRPSAITANTEYYCIIWDSCGAYSGYVASDTTDTLSVTMRTGSITAGNTNPNQYLCMGTTPNTTYLTGHSGGTVTKWQWATDNLFTTPTDIISTDDSATGASIETSYGGSVNGTIWVRAVLDNANCPETYSNPSIISVNSPTTVTFVDDSATCSVNGAGGWQHFYRDSTGRVIASLNSYGQNLGNATVKVFQHSGRSIKASTPSNCLTQFAVMNRNFVINADSTFTNPVGVRLYFTDTELAELIDSALETQSTGGALTWATNDPVAGCLVNDDVTNIGDVLVTQVSGATLEDSIFDPTDGLFILKSPSNSGTGNNTFNANYVEFTVTDFSEFWLHGSEEGHALPVGLLRFKAKDLGKNIVRLEWTTVEEINSSHFILYRKINESGNFIPIAKVNSKISTSSIIDYGFDDDLGEDFSGTIYYQLKQVDKNGDSQFSRIIAINKKQDDLKKISISPNPVNSDLKISIEDYSQKFEYKIYDLKGKLLQQGISKSNESISISQLTAGVYQVQIVLNGIPQILKICIQ